MLTSTPVRERWALPVWLAIAVVVVTLPVAWGFVVALQTWLLPREFHELMVTLEPLLTPVAWLCAVCSVPVNLGAFYVHRLLVRRLVKPEQTAVERQWQLFQVLMVSGSVAQLPGFLALFLLLLGGATLPVALALVSSTGGVAVLAWALR